jgi:preprotein translocase subunit SecA
MDRLKFAARKGAKRSKRAWSRRTIESAQRKGEARNIDIRKQLHSNR